MGPGLHGWGVALGLGVKATIGQPRLTIETGIAHGRGGPHISLAQGGRAEVRQGAPGGPAPRSIPIMSGDGDGGRGDAGHAGSADYPAGTYVVTIEWRESWLPAAAVLDAHARLRLLPGPVQDGIQIPLALRSTLEAGGAVAALAEGSRRAAVVPPGGSRVAGSRPFMGKVARTRRRQLCGRGRPEPGRRAAAWS